MKKSIILICLLLCISLLSGCITIEFESQNHTSNEESSLNTPNTDEPEIDEPNTDNPEANKPEVDEPEIYEPEIQEPAEEKDNNNSSGKVDTAGARVGTATNPIKVGETGKIEVANYSAADEKSTIYMFLKEVISGSQANQIIKDYEENSFYTFDEQDGFEYRVAIFTVDLKDFETKDYGKSTKSVLPFAALRDKNGEMLKHNNQIYSSFGHSMGNPDIEDIHQGDVVDCYLIYAIPEGFTQGYTIEFDDEDVESVFFLME